jgi:hypothetical protein
MRIWFVVSGASLLKSLLISVQGSGSETFFPVPGRVFVSGSRFSIVARMLNVSGWPVPGSDRALPAPPQTGFSRRCRFGILFGRLVVVRHNGRLVVD